MTQGEIAPGAAAGNPAARPRAVSVAGAGAFAEAVGMTCAAGAWLFQVVTHGSSATGVAVFLILSALGLAAVLVAAARALLGGSRRARGPLITWQVLQAATALAVLQVPGRSGWLAAGAVTAVVLAAGVVAGLLTPRAVAFGTR